MTYRAILLNPALSFALLAAAGLPQDSTSILGVWQAKMDDLPFVTLTITDEGGKLAGAILFFLIRRDEGKPPSSSPGIPEPLLNPKLAGKNLTFQVSHRRAHPGTQSDPPVSFRFALTGPAEGNLIQEGGEPESIKMTREK